MQSKKNLGTIELRGDRLYLLHQLRGLSVELDVTPLWHFFKEVDAYMREPSGSSDCEVCKFREHNTGYYSPCPQHQIVPCRPDCKYDCSKHKEVTHDCDCHGS